MSNYVIINVVIVRTHEASLHHQTEEDGSDTFSGLVLAREGYMYNRYRVDMHRKYNIARATILQQPEIQVAIEKYITNLISSTLATNYTEFETDYNEASYLQPFWEQYPPEDRGRSPVGDQVPWIEVGEHAIGHKLCRLIASRYRMRETGLPSGADNRFVLVAEDLQGLTGGLTDSVMVFLDIKSVGPRDDFEHTVISPYQVSGDGLWTDATGALTNSPLVARGRIASHSFYPAISPIYILSDGTIAPTIHVFVKPVYRMMSLDGNGDRGQPLKSIRIVCVPNGPLLTVNPGYLNIYPGIFFPGKDDKNKPATKVRCRVSFELLSRIASWRVTEVRTMQPE